MIEQRLLDVASGLCRRTGRRPREAFMRRAVSTAYYALFAALSRMCANELAGAGRARTPEWTKVYRSLDHGWAKRVLTGKSATALDERIRAIGNTFALLQDRRHRADYDPSFFPFYFDETAVTVDLARSAIDDLRRLDADSRRALAIHLLFKDRNA